MYLYWLLPPFEQNKIVHNGHGFEYPKGILFQNGCAFYIMKQVEKKMHNYCKPDVAHRVSVVCFCSNGVAVETNN